MKTIFTILLIVIALNFNAPKIFSQPNAIKFEASKSTATYGNGMNIAITVDNLVYTALISQSAFESQMKANGFAVQILEGFCYLAYQQMDMKYPDYYVPIKKCAEYLQVNWSGEKTISGFRKLQNELDEQEIAPVRIGAALGYSFTTNFSNSKYHIRMSFERENKNLYAYETLIIHCEKVF